MSFELRFIPEAEETYEAVISQLSARWGQSFVIKFENKVKKIFNTISLTPYLYPIVEENTETRKCVLHKNCSMLYKIQGNVILIICFWDNRQEPISV
jgi:hypothetical protein